MRALSILRGVISPIQRSVLEGLLYAMTPIARFLLRTGISYREFSQVCKLAFVQVATDDYGIRGRPTNTSRVAVMTGLTRKEVKRIRVAQNEGTDLWVENLNPPTQTLNYWNVDPDFSDGEGNPKDLRFVGEFPSFTDLVGRYAGDIPPGAMRTELKRSGSVIELEDGTLRAINDCYIPFELDSDFAQTWAFSLANLASTLAYNASLYATEEPGVRQAKARIERYVWSQALAKSDNEKFKIMAASKAEELLSELNDWILKRELEGADETSLTKGDKETARAGLGIYYFES